MNCSVCHRPHHATKLPFLCVNDARGLLYESRVEHAKTLIQNDMLESQINAVLDGQPGTTQGEQSGARRAQLDQLRSQEDTIRERTDEIIAQADRLKVQIEAAKEEIREKRDIMARRKSDLESVSTTFPDRSSKHYEETEKAVVRARYKWNRCAKNMASTRAFLCEEAARLYGLRQVRKGSTRRYEIGGVEIIDPHAMNSASPEVISTSLAHIAHILVLTSHYLAIRLPSEITLPHRDYPRPTIFNINSSYKKDRITYGESGIKSQYQYGDQPGTRGPTPRPLFIDKPLPTLAKEDPQAYSFFIEGVSLLAHNIAWACCSQGVTFGDKDSYEDVCNMGQNLWRLLIGDQVHRRSVQPMFSSATPVAGSPEEEERVIETANPKSMIGYWSHGSAHSFLGSAEGTEFIRSFKLLAPMKIADKLKKQLSSEAPMLEWETIDGDEVEDGYEEPVLNKGRPGAGQAHYGVESIMSVQGGGGGTNGWTRVKNRGADR